MGNIEIDRWVNGCKVRAFKWIDGKSIYVNVQYFNPGAPVEKLPEFDKSVYVTINDNGMNVINNFLDSLVNHIIGLQMEKDKKVVLTF